MVQIDFESVYEMVLDLEYLVGQERVKELLALLLQMLLLFVVRDVSRLLVVAEVSRLLVCRHHPRGNDVYSHQTSLSILLFQNLVSLQPMLQWLQTIHQRQHGTGER